jgi:hypothetical protein
MLTEAKGLRMKAERATTCPTQTFFSAGAEKMYAAVAAVAAVATVATVAAVAAAAAVAAVAAAAAAIAVEEIARMSSVRTTGGTLNYCF